MWIRRLSLLILISQTDRKAEETVRVVLWLALKKMGFRFLSFGICFSSQLGQVQ